MGDSHTASGMVRLYGSWDLVDKGGKNSGSFIFKVENRHKFTNTDPKNFGFNIGYVGMIEPPFNDDKFRMTNFYWRQRLLDGRISFVVGLLDATDYVDVYAMASPWLHFMNFAFSTGSETVYIPNDVNLGIAAAAYITDNIYVIAGINDAGSNPKIPFKSFETFFSNHNYFKSVELGWVSSRSRHFFDNIHAVYWHSDGSEVTASLPGWGLSFSATYFINDKLFPFLRGGYAKDGGTLLQKSINAGLGYYAKPGGNLLGFAIGWGQPNETSFGPNLRNQITSELFYRINITDYFVFTPDIQFISNPALNPDVNSIFIWGARGRINL